MPAAKRLLPVSLAGRSSFSRCMTELFLTLFLVRFNRRGQCHFVNRHHQPNDTMKTAKTYSIADLLSATSLKGFGKIKTGMTDAVRYVKVRVDDGGRYPVAILVTYGKDAPCIINDSARISQFLHRGC